MSESKQLRLHLQVHGLYPLPSVEGEVTRPEPRRALIAMGCGSRDLALYGGVSLLVLEIEFRMPLAKKRDSMVT